MEIGIHCEPGPRRVKLTEADQIADEMILAICSDFREPDFREQVRGNVLLLLNGFGGRRP